MAEETATPPENDEELLLDTPLDGVAPEAGDPPAEEEEEIPTFGDAAPADEPESPTIRHMRLKLEDAHKKIAELSRSKEEPLPADLGPEPQLEDFDFDIDKFQTAVKERARQEVRIEARSKAPANDDAQVEATRLRINAEKEALGKPDVDDAFDTVRSTLNELQQSLLVATVEPGATAKLIYALAKNPDKLSALAAQNDIPRFIKEVAKLEGQLKMVKRRAPDPDVPERGSARTAVGTNAAQKQLDKMEAEWARKGGDRTEIQRFKRQHGLK